jgi:hypothetical protein
VDGHSWEGTEGMVIGKEFAWAHLPKTGGDTTRTLFESFPGLVQFADPGDANAKHVTFHERMDVVRGKLLAMNVRRLPAWVLSRAHHVAREGVWPDYIPQPMPSSAELAESTLPDQRLEYFAFRGPLRVERWLRLEHLREDFLALVVDLTEVTAVQARRVRELPALDVADYDREPRHWFSETQLDLMYERNPRWAALERQLYGGLLAPVPDAAGV